MKITELSGFGISESITDELLKLGFEELTEIQNLAVKAGLFEGKSLLVSAPTNTGKTFVGELAAITASTRKDLRRTFFLVPLRALAEEQFEDLVRKYSDWGLKVAISTSDRTEFDDNLLDSDVIIATYEKLTALLIRNPNLFRSYAVDS